MSGDVRTLARALRSASHNTLPNGDLTLLEIHGRRLVEKVYDGEELKDQRMVANDLREDSTAAYALAKDRTFAVYVGDDGIIKVSEFDEDSEEWDEADLEGLGDVPVHDESHVAVAGLPSMNLVLYQAHDGTIKTIKHDKDADIWTEEFDIPGLAATGTPIAGFSTDEALIVSFFGDDNEIHVHSRDFETGDWTEETIPDSSFNDTVNSIIVAKDKDSGDFEAYVLTANTVYNITKTSSRDTVGSFNRDEDFVLSTNAESEAVAAAAARATRAAATAATADALVPVASLVGDVGLETLIWMLCVQMRPSWYREICYHIGQAPPDQTLAQALDNPTTIDDFQKGVEKYVEDSDLGQLFAPGNNYLQKVAEKAIKLKDDPSNHPKEPEQMKGLVKLALYQPIFYCNDSGSMQANIVDANGNVVSTRIEGMRSLVQRMARIATRLVPDSSGAHLRFINSDDQENDPTADQIDACMQFQPGCRANIGTDLKKKVLGPLIFKKLEQDGKIDRPFLVLTITDATMFLISQVGNDPHADKFLDSLSGDSAINRVLFRSSAPAREVY
ncbi:ankyrin repeat [Fusarium acutatum]|uniref:Ankyrin repeat n=1 Tax=Fusarium acutatum TaxID=78861 RepID=A0A8H4JX49_9HYPO|nr:ankyrin repeat [Fusarium acutatum]